MRKILFSLGLLSLASLGMGQETGYNTNWSGHRTLHINTQVTSQTATAISANVLKYPMLVRLGPADSAIFAASKLTGADIRFTKSTNTERLKHQIEQWDSAGRSAAIWVLLDTVYSNNLTQTFRMHWGNASAADSSKATAVFDTANGYQAVWHMNGAGSGNESDATINNFTARDSNGVASAAGVIGLARTFTGGNGSGAASGTVTNNDVLIVDGSASGKLNFPQNGTYTLSGWFNPSDADNNRSMITKGDNQYALKMESAAPQRWEMQEYNQSGSAPIGWQSTFAPRTNGVWQHVMGVRKGDSSLIYLNGVLTSTTIGGSASANPRDTTPNVNIGKRSNTATVHNNNNYYAGLMDELRISNVSRGADWAALDYASQRAGQTLVADSSAPMLAYAVDTLRAEAGFPVITTLPTVFTGIPHPTVAVDVALPAGLTFTTGNTNRGQISGTYTGTTGGTTRHIITATNAKGTAVDTVYITVVANAENYTTWTNMKTLNFTSPATVTVTQYPFLLRLGPADSAIFSGAGTNGASLRFSRTDAIKLKYSIEHWDAVARRAAIWVLMDQVTTGANTLRLHWGNGTAASQSSPSEVFSRANGHVGVWHLGNASGAAARPNSVQPGVNDAVPGGSATSTMLPIPGVIGMADSLRQQLGTSGAKGTDDHFYLGNGIRFANYQMSMSMWVNLPVTLVDGWNHFIGFGNSNNSDNVWFGRVGSNNDWKARGAANGAESNSDASLVVTNGLNPRPAWAHFAITRSGTLGRRWTMHKNGVQLIDFTGSANSHDLLTTVRDSNFIGRALWPDPNTRAAVDEARVANVARSAAWFQLDYATQRPGASPVSNLTYPAIGGTPGAPITPRGPSLSGTAVNYTLTGTLPAGIVFNDTTGVFSGTPTGPSSATVTVTANSGVWSTSGTATLNFGAADGAYATAWSGHQWVSVNPGGANGVQDTLRRFPLLVRLGAANADIFTASQKNGGDIRFTKLDNVTRLKHEIEHWDSAGRSAAVWVLVDTVYGRTSGSRLRLHFGNATVADSSQPRAVFDSANSFLSVFHMGGVNAAAPRANSVAGGNPAQPAGSTANLASGWPVFRGMIGLADTLRGQGTGTNTAAKSADDHLELGTTGYANFANGITLSMWAKPIAVANVGTGWTQYISFSNGTAADNLWMGRQGNTMNFTAEVFNAATVSGYATAADVQVYGEWALLTFTMNGTAMTLYRNGAQVGTFTSAVSLRNIERTQNHIARTPYGDRNYGGGVDEVRLSKTARSAGWVKMEYANQHAAQTGSVVTTALVPITVDVVGIDVAAGQAGSVLSFKAMNKGLLFRINAGETGRKTRLAIVDMQGRTIWSRTVATASGMNQVEWNGASSTGAAINSGIYVVRMSLLDADGKISHRLDKKIPLTR